MFVVQRAAVVTRRNCSVFIYYYYYFCLCLLRAFHVNVNSVSFGPEMYSAQPYIPFLVRTRVSVRQHKCGVYAYFLVMRIKLNLFECNNTAARMPYSWREWNKVITKDQSERETKCERERKRNSRIHAFVVFVLAAQKKCEYLFVSGGNFSFSRLCVCFVEQRQNTENATKNTNISRTEIEKWKLQSHSVVGTPIYAYVRWDVDKWTWLAMLPTHKMYVYIF